MTALGRRAVDSDYDSPNAARSQTHSPARRRTLGTSRRHRRLGIGQSPARRPGNGSPAKIAISSSGEFYSVSVETVPRRDRYTSSRSRRSATLREERAASEGFAPSKPFGTGTVILHR